ncbi:sensor histidine kinase [Gulosibacter molinativorax]|uniref:sensor histidine kinase n=1 Tax=Gulosibacter molinativorax TaxID=256821 RepID=UPI0004260844|nr:HAMP domain-containing sensor histidine kinase [Gulosibacter molinativorax]
MIVFGLLAMTVILIGVGQQVATSRTQQLTLQRANSMDQLTQRAQTAITLGDGETLQEYLDEFHETFGESVLIIEGTGAPLAAAGDITLDDEVAQLALAASRAVPQWSLATAYPWSVDTALVAEPLISDTGTVTGVVVLDINQAAAKRDITEQWILVGAIGLALFAVLLAAAMAWMRWILRPVSALDSAALAMANHQKLDLGDATGPPELRRLAESFRQMSDSVEAALEQQHGLVADASHQLRTPLAAIRLRMDSLSYDLGEANSSKDPDAARQFVAEDVTAIDADLDRLERTVERMLTLANAEHRAGETISGHAFEVSVDGPERSTVSATSLAEAHRAGLQAAGIRLITEGETFRVVFRQSDLDEIIEILLDNARKYAGEGATVWVSLKPDGDAVILEVADSGPGLDDEQLARIGTRFWRATGHSALPGTGLGHAILTQLARANHATVLVDRARQGGLRTRVRMRAT